MMRRQIVGMLVVCAIVGGSVGCGGPKQGSAAPVVQPDVELARAMEQFRRGQFRKAQLIFQRLTFEFSVTQDRVAQAHVLYLEALLA